MVTSSMILRSINVWMYYYLLRSRTLYLYGEFVRCQYQNYTAGPVFPVASSQNLLTIFFPLPSLNCSYISSHCIPNSTTPVPDFLLVSFERSSNRPLLYYSSLSHPKLLPPPPLPCPPGLGSMTEIVAGESLPSDLLTTLPYTSTTAAHPPTTDPSSVVLPPAAKYSSTTGSISRGNRRSIAGLALEKTSNVIANLTTSWSTISPPGLRTSSSTGSLSRQSHRYSQVGGASLSADRELSSEKLSALPLTKVPSSGPTRRGTVRLLPQEQDSLENSAASRANKMHQTSSRLLRMTEDDRPFTKVCFESSRGTANCSRL